MSYHLQQKEQNHNFHHPTPHDYPLSKINSPINTTLKPLSIESDVKSTSLNPL